MTDDQAGEPQMFCYQCEQARNNVGCESSGVCGKSAETGELHDVLFHVVRQLSTALVTTPAAARLRYHAFIEDALFATMSNVNFDAGQIAAMVERGRDLTAQLHCRTHDTPPGSTARTAMRHAAQVIAIPLRQRRLGAERVGMQEIVAYGIKGLAAITRQARALGAVSPVIGDAIIEALADLTNPHSDTEKLLAHALRCGAMALSAMELLDNAHSRRFGQPEPGEVRLGVRQGKAILVSGHELDDLERILQATAGSDIKVYTHGEMMAAHGYPGLKRHPHLAGHHGGAWHDQHKVFAAFPGAIVMTGSCLMPPRKAYKARLFTLGAMAFPGVQHLSPDDLQAVIDCARTQAGFAEDRLHGRQWIGFGHHATLRATDTLVNAVRSGDIERFVLIGGCDGPTSGRDYFSRLAENLPANWAVLTLGCGKFRVHGRVKGNINGLPRLLDIGQCSDTFSAIKISRGLAAGLGVPLEELPLSLVLSWHEQKAITIILALLHLGVRNIRVGPRMPAFVGPAMQRILFERFGLLPTGEVAQDIQSMALSA